MECLHPPALPLPPLPPALPPPSLFPSRNRRPPAVPSSAYFEPIEQLSPSLASLKLGVDAPPGMVRAAIVVAATNDGTARISGILFSTRDRRPAGDIPAVESARPIPTDSSRTDGNTLRGRDPARNDPAADRPADRPAARLAFLGFLAARRTERIFIHFRQMQIRGRFVGQTGRIDLGICQRVENSINVSVITRGFRSFARISALSHHLFLFYSFFYFFIFFRRALSDGLRRPLCYITTTKFVYAANESDEIDDETS